MVCNSELFVSDDWKYTIMYHRGLQFSSFVVGNKKFINDGFFNAGGIAETEKEVVAE